MFTFPRIIARRTAVAGALVGVAAGASWVASPQVRAATATAVAGATGAAAANGNGNGNGNGPGTFTMTGVTTQTLRPGVSSPVNLTLANAFNYDIFIGDIRVSTALTTNRIDCPASNFTTTAYSGPVALNVLGGKPETLRTLNVPEAQWPHVSMLPSAPNACQGVKFSLTYSATATKK